MKRYIALLCILLWGLAFMNFIDNTISEVDTPAESDGFGVYVRLSRYVKW